MSVPTAAVSCDLYIYYLSSMRVEIQTEVEIQISSPIASRREVIGNVELLLGGAGGIS